MCKNLEDLISVVNRQPDLVILAVKYISIEQGQDIWLSEFFSKHKINYSGSPREVLKYDSDKVLAKSYLMKKGINTASFFTATPGLYSSEASLPLTYPLFLKPVDAANGNGIDDLSIVKNFAEFESKVLTLHKMFDMPVLVEEYLGGQEFTVAIIKTADNKLIVSAVEIVPPQSSNGLRILGEKTKKEDSELIRKIDEPTLLNNVSALAIKVFDGLEVQDFGRIDIKADKYGCCYFLEANLVPGMTSGSSYFPMACEIANNLTYDEVILHIVEKGISRSVNDDLILPSTNIAASNSCETRVGAM